MNNQSNHNSFGDQFESRKKTNLPEEIKFSDNGSGYSPGNRQGKGGSPRVNRTLYVTAIILLLSVAIIAAVTSAANRSKKNPTPTESSTPQTSASTPMASTPHSTPAATPENTPAATPAPESTPTVENVAGKIPTFSLPVSGVLAVGHDPDIQVFSPTMQEYRVHLGLDINTTEGAPVYAAAKGQVTKIWNDALMGWCIEISHSGDACTYYKNLSETMASGIEVGASVRDGQLLGSVGESAILEVAQEPHLHFEITVNGKQEDPIEFFTADVLAELEGDENFEG